MRKVMQLMPVPTAVVAIKLSQGKKDLKTPNIVSDHITDHTGMPRGTNRKIPASQPTWRGRGMMVLKREM